MAAPTGAGRGGYLLRCASLDRTVDDAVARGDIATTTRSEPAVAPLAAGNDRRTLR
ncbi:hypothetical protein AB0H42_23490 [Nocardia sp. NPDC050799]|uniref:hypothetical protein n=1 Tax=Nocardia sp. NPDC050799 TaxID=3154842 RepID=UPI0033E59D44